MTAVAAQPVQRFVFPDASWDFYTSTLYELEAQGLHTRVTYDDGWMELMTTGDNHERAKKVIARLIEQYSLEMDIPALGLGQITCRRKDLRKGLEPDECYYVRTEPPPMSQGELDLLTYPPPDLAVEVEITRGSIPRQPIYAALGVDEIWRFDGERLTVLHRTPDGRYEPHEKSLAFPELCIDQLNRFIRQALTGNQHEAIKAFRDWVRSLRK